MTKRQGQWVGILAAAALVCSATAALPQQDPVVIFAVVTKVSKDKKHVVAQVSEGGAPVEAALIPTDPILDNLIWRKLEICHALRAEAWKNPEGYRIVGVRVLDASMLPMPLQGVAGDCLIKKALEFGPLVD
ncbi:MAG: hypothetical protein ACKOCD_11005 [Nitrospiraceae bacterium]